MNLLDIPYSKFTLDNGLEVIVHENRSLPLVTVNIWYRVGSSNERPGKTGLAHLFEHMMFQGSQHVDKGLHFKIIQEAGGSLNGSTNFDRTNYYEKVPSTFLETALWLEADRMGWFLPSLTSEKLENQRGVVSNERLERYDNQPYGRTWELLFSNLFESGHPYSWPTIGWMDDILSYSLDDVARFFQSHYQPANACLVVAGDVAAAEAEALAKKYFDEIDSPAPVPVDPPPEAGTLPATRRIAEPDTVQLERVHYAWHSQKFFDSHDASLDLLADVLTGSKAARLTKSLVYEKELAQSVSAFQFSGRLAGIFIIMAALKPGVSKDDLYAEIEKEITNIIDNGVTDRELQRARNGYKAGFIYSMQNIDTIANQLNQYNYFLGEPNSFGSDLQRYMDTTGDDIVQSANDFLRKPHLELLIHPKGNA